MTGTGTIWIVSTRGPDDKPVREITWDAKRYYAPVEDVRQTAIDLVTCAAYAEMMMKLAGLGLPAVQTCPRFTSDLLSDAGRSMFGSRKTVTLLPAGSTKNAVRRWCCCGAAHRRVPCHRMRPGGWRRTGSRSRKPPNRTRLVAEALRATGCEADTGKVFGYLRELRDRK